MNEKLDKLVEEDDETLKSFKDAILKNNGTCSGGGSISLAHL